MDKHHAHEYLSRPPIAHIDEADAVVADDLATVLPGRFLDLGCGAGRLTALLLSRFPGSVALGLDFSPTMLDAARAAGVSAALVRHDLECALPVVGRFTAVVSSLAIHHLEDRRKAELYAEAAALLEPGGVMVNLDVVASPTVRLHERWREEIGITSNASDRLSSVEEQLGWMRAAGLDDVDCIWKWRALAVLRGERPVVGCSASAGA